MWRLARTLLLVALTAALGWLAMTSLAPGSWVASWAPCPRNWAWAPAWLPRASPLAAAKIRFERGHAKICYGRPSLRGRVMLGGEAVPYGRLWRTGANEPTTLHLDVPAEMGELFLPPGSYSLYSVPAEARWEIVVNRATRQWGLESLYDESIAAHEVGRLVLPAEPLARPIETLTITPVPVGGDHWSLHLEWQTTRVRIPLRAAGGAPHDGEEAEPFEAGG
jgi:hypothetical protein